MAQKRILLIGGNFYPELTGIGKYNGEMIDWLAEQGYACTVITTYPYYPDWKIKPPYFKRSFWFSKELKSVPANPNNSIKIYRCPHFVPSNPSGLTRILSDISFCLSAAVMVFASLFRKKYDYIITVSPPFLTGIYAAAYKKIKGAKFFYHVQDLQIDAAADLQMIKSRTLINILFKMEKYILKRADLISSISDGMIARIEQKLSKEKKVSFFPNWVDTSIFYPLPEKDGLKEAFGFNAKDKIVLYSGAIGEKQGLEAILHTADSLKNISNLKFIICGSGPYKKKLEDLKTSLALENVFFMPLQPLEKLNKFLNLADVHLVIQKANASDLVMPSKLTSILAVGGLAVITAPIISSLFKVVNTYQMAILAEPENQTALTEAIKLAINQVDKSINNNARKYAKEFLSIDQILKKYEEDMSNA